METPHIAVADLVTKLHANIDSIHACINSLSDTSSHDAELERLEVEREEKIKELRKAHEDAVKALADQRQKEKEELEEKRRKEQDELEKQRRKEYEELMARRKKEDEERKAKLEAEEEERERMKGEEDEKRQQETEDSEKTLQEKVERELEALEDEMERKIEEGKKALQDLDEKRKAINAQIDAALNTPTVIPEIKFRSRAKTLSRGPKTEMVSDISPKKEVVEEKPVSGISDGSQGERGVAASNKPAETAQSKVESSEIPTEAQKSEGNPVSQASEPTAKEDLPKSEPENESNAIHEPSVAKSDENGQEPKPDHADISTSNVPETPDLKEEILESETVPQPDISEHENTGADTIAPIVSGSELSDVQSDRGEDKDVRDSVGQFSGEGQHEAEISKEPKDKSYLGEVDEKDQPRDKDLHEAALKPSEEPVPEQEVDSQADLAPGSNSEEPHHLEFAGTETSHDQLEPESHSPSNCDPRHVEEYDQVPTDNDHPEESERAVPSEIRGASVEPEMEDTTSIPETKSTLEETRPDDSDNHTGRESPSDIHEGNGEHEKSVDVSILEAEQSLEPKSEVPKPQHADETSQKPEIPTIVHHDGNISDPEHQEPPVQPHGLKNKLEALSAEQEPIHPPEMATPEPPHEGLGEAASTLAIVPETSTSDYFTPDALLVESKKDDKNTSHQDEPVESGVDVDHTESNSNEPIHEAEGPATVLLANADEKHDDQTRDINIHDLAPEGQVSHEHMSEEHDDSTIAAPETKLEAVPSREVGSYSRDISKGDGHSEKLHDPEDHVDDDHLDDKQASSAHDHQDAHVNSTYPIDLNQESIQPHSSVNEPLEHSVPHVIEPEIPSTQSQERSTSVEETPRETPMSQSDEFFTPMVGETEDRETSQYPLPDQSRSQEPTPTFPKSTEHEDEYSDAVLPRSVGVDHPNLESTDEQLSIDPVSHTIVPHHIIEALDEAGVDTLPSQGEVPAVETNHLSENKDSALPKKDSHLQPVDTSSTFADHQDVSRPMTAASSRADTWVSAEEEQDTDDHDTSGAGTLSTNIAIIGYETPSSSHDADLESWQEADDKLMPSPRGLGAATMHHSREVDRQSTPPNTQVPVDTTHENEYQRALNNVATEPGFTPLERPQPELEEYSRPRTPIQVPHFSEHHAESPVTVLNSDDLFDDDSDDEDSFPAVNYQDASPVKSSEPISSGHESPVTDNIVDEYLEGPRGLDLVREHEPLHHFNESPHRNSGLFANLVDTIRPDLDLVRQMSDDVNEHEGFQSSRPQSVSFDESAGPYDYTPHDSSLHIRTHTADTVPSFESYAHSDTPSSPSEAASSPFQETPHDEPRIQSSWHDEVPADDQHQELKPQASPLQAEFDPFNSTANPSYVTPHSSQSNLRAEHDPFGYSGVDAPRLSTSNVRNSPSLSPRLPMLNTSDASPFSEGRPYDSPVSATNSLREGSSPSPPPSSLARRPTTGPKIASNRTPVSSPSIPSNSFFQKTRSLFETGAAVQQQSPSPPPARPLSGFFSVGKAPPPTPPRTSRPSSLYQTERAEYNEEEDGEPIIPRSLDGDGRPPSPVFIPSSSPARSSTNSHTNSRSGSVSSLRKSISREEDENSNATNLNKRASNPFLGGLSRLVGAGSGGLEESIHNPERTKLLGKDVGVEQERK